MINYIKQNYALIFILLFSSALRIYHIDYQSLWIDEINTMIQANPNQSFTDTYKSLLTLDLQPPLYFYILKYLFRFFGYTTFILRFLSALLGIAGVWAIYLLGREIINKKTGIYAALILSVNLYHIYYSQEARPYAFFFLFTVLSFYALIKYLKSLTYKNAFFYGLLTSLMLYGHPYGLFSLLSQYIIILYYFFQSENNTKWLFFKQYLVSFITTLIFYIPAIPILMNAASVTSFWIGLPEAEVYTNIFKEFFSNSEFLLSIVYLIIIFFFIKAFDESNDIVLQPNNKENSVKKVFLIIILWLLIGTLIPFIRSYLKVPMIVTRYLIGLLPAIIILIAVGIALIKISLIRNLLLILIVTFSLTTIFVVKKYYTNPNKTELKKAAEFVLANKNDSDIIASRIGWHYGFYFQKIKNPLYTTPLDGYITGIMADSLHLKPFWYVDGTSIIESLDKAKQAFIENYFVIAKKINLYGAIAHYYKPKRKNTITLHIKQFNPIAANEYGVIPFYWNGFSKSQSLKLTPGLYTIYLGGKSQPSNPVNGINAHVRIKVNDKNIGGFFLSEKDFYEFNTLKFKVNKEQTYTIELVYDNDLILDNKDRNALIYSVYIEKND